MVTVTGLLLLLQLLLLLLLLLLLQLLTDLVQEANDKDGDANRSLEGAESNGDAPETTCARPVNTLGPD